MKRKLLAVGVMFTWLLAGCSTLPPQGIVPVASFDVQRYSGTWYEIARFDHTFEHGMTDVRAKYTVQADGTVQVINRGFDPGKNQWSEAIGKARFNGEPGIASLKVSFFGPFYGGYHVVALDKDYQWAMVAGNDRSYLWILSRSRVLDPAVRTPLLARARAMGFDTGKLVWVSHTRLGD